MEKPSPHVRNLLDQEPFFKNEYGNIKRLTVHQFEILKNLSIKRVVLRPGAIREPHWHVNANELTYCLEGKLLVSILDSGNGFSTFTLNAGEMFYVTSGSLHFFENICNTTEAVLLVAFRNEDPVDFSLQAAFGEMSNAVLGNTFGDSSQKWSAVKRDTQPRWIVKRESGEPRIPDPDHFPNPHKFDIEAQNPPILARSHNVHIGSAKTAKSQFWPILDNISMYSVRVEEEGMREPHWHPQTGEMGYVNKGQARMSIMNLDGCVDTYELRPGDVYFVPAAYPHQIEVIGKEDIHFLIFFDQPMPFDIGYRIAATAMSRDVLAATLGVPVHLLPETPRTGEDPLIVPRINPVDKVTHSEGTKGEEQRPNRGEK